MFERGLPYLKKAPRLACARDARPWKIVGFFYQGFLARICPFVADPQRNALAAEICKTAAAAATGFSRRVYEAGKRNELPSAAGWERRMEFDNALPWERTEIRVSPLLRYANLLNGINARLES